MTSFDAVFKKVSNIRSDCHIDTYSMPKCLLAAVFDPVFTMLCVAAKKLIALCGQNLVKACVAKDNKWWKAAGA